MTNPQHWDAIYSAKPSSSVSWYRPHLDLSLALIERSGISLDTPIIDVGGGSSTLVDDLIQRGYTNVRVLDISGIALKIAKDRLGDRAKGVEWIEADVIATDLGENSAGLWHDRAVFHFLTEPADREAYARIATRTVRPEGFLIIATFAPDGPAHCSGLPVVRDDAHSLAAQFPRFRLLDSANELHVTPSKIIQSFTYVFMRKNSETP